MIRSNHEKASGGPFFRSLQRRGGSGGIDLYDIYYYSMGKSKAPRTGARCATTGWLAGHKARSYGLLTSRLAPAALQDTPMS